MKRIVSLLMLGAVMFTALFHGNEFTAYAVKKDVVVVIDPGHGGDGEKNTGAIYNGITEKDITLQLSTALKAELDKYDGITVYMTRTTDTFSSLEDRAAYAKSVGADFLFSIHFNASVSHFFYGSEVWTSAFGNYYKAGSEFGNIVSSQWNELGLYQKGVKTKLGSKGQDYYGIIRHSVARNMPAVILEHAYLDHTNDVSMVKTGSFVNQLAVADATAIAKYFHLKSSQTGADFSNFQYATVKKPSKKLHQDETGPDMCNIQVLAQDSASGNILVEMDTKDSQSPVIYFSYSYDGGNNFCPLQMWDRTKNKQSFNVKVPSGTVDPVIVCRSYNSYEKCTESEPVAVTGSFNY
jgi:N-acetylmuramoyl-L-alanine amidase